MTDMIISAPINKELQVELKKGISAIDRKMKKLAGDYNYIFKAPSSFKYNENDNNNINIQQCTDLNYLIKALSMIKRVEIEYNKTVLDMGIETSPVCKWLQVPAEAWISDLTVLIKRLVNKDTIDRLRAKREELTKFVSAEERLSEILTELKTLMK